MDKKIEKFIIQLEAIARRNPRNYGRDTAPQELIIVNVGENIVDTAEDKPSFEKQLDEVLGYAEISDHYKKYIRGNVIAAYELGAGIDWILTPFKENDHEIFDKGRSQAAEKQTLIAATQGWTMRVQESWSPATRAPRAKELEKCRDWLISYQTTYGEDQELKELLQTTNAVLLQ